MSLLEWFGAAPTQRAFAQRLLAALQGVGKHQWTLDSAAGQLRNDEGALINLHNLYCKYVGTPRAGRAQCLQQLVAMAYSPRVPALWSMAQHNVYPLLRSRHEGLSQFLSLRGTGEVWPAMAQQPLLDDLVVKLGYDFGDHVSQVSQEQLAAWGGAVSDVHGAARRNLAGLASPRWESVGDGVLRLYSEVSYAESMMLLDRVIDALPFAPRAVCCPSNRGILFAADGSDEAAVSRLIEAVIAALTNEPWPITGTLCERTAQGWRTWTPPAALVRAANGVRSLAQAQVYAEQREALQSLHDAAGRDVYVADISLLRRDGAIEGYTVWSEGVCALLPQTDLVGFHGAGVGASPLLVPWDAVRRICGHRMQAETEDPPRWLTLSFPDAQELGSLAASKL